VKAGISKTLNRWLRSKLQRNAEWQLSPQYWNLSRKWQSFRFRINRLIFRARYRKHSAGEGLNNSRAIISGILWPVFTAILVLGLLDFTEYLFINYSRLVYGTLHIPSFIIRGTGGLQSILTRSEDAYLELMGTISQIAGAFLGLYFATAGVVISTVYARVPRNVRQLLIHDKLSNQYIRAMALLGASALMLMGSMAAGLQPGILNLLYIVLLGVYTIFSAVVLGLRILNFFDPSRLVGRLTGDLVRWIEEATTKGFQWNDANFQAHYQQQAEEILVTYRDILSLASREEHLQSSALIELTKNVFSLLRYYISRKHSIPSDSRWFRPDFKHRNWLTAEDSRISMALGTGTTLQPETIPDQMWLESEIVEAMALSLEGLVERQDLTRAYSFTNNASQTLGVLARSYAFDEALYLYQALSPSLKKLSRSVEASAWRPDERLTRLKTALGLTDLYGLGFINLLVGFSHSLSSLTAESLRLTVKSIVWESAGSIYSSPLPRQVVQQLEFLRRRLMFEIRVEKQVISPLWYQQQLVALSFIRFIESVTARLVAELEEVFTKEIEALVKEGRYLFAAQLIARGLEACSKFDYHFNEAKACVDRLAGLRRVEDIPWPAISWDEYHKKIAEVRERQVVSLGAIANHLASITRTEQLPDYFGHAYSVLAEECYQALVAGDEKLFGQLFPSFFSASLSAHNQLIATKVAHDPIVQYGFAVQPLLDLLDLSGYALIYSELYGKDYAAQARGRWEVFFSEVSDADKAAHEICYKLRLHESYSGWGIYPRDLRRTTWKQIFDQVLRNEGLMQGFSDYDWRGKKVNHSSALIRVLAQGIFSIYDANSVFLALYFIERFGEQTVPITKGAKQFLRSIDHERGKGDQSSEGEEE
jgi:hypothetical protein